MYRQHSSYNISRSFFRKFKKSELYCDCNIYTSLSTQNVNFFKIKYIVWDFFFFFFLIGDIKNIFIGLTNQPGPDMIHILWSSNHNFPTKNITRVVFGFLSHQNIFKIKKKKKKKKKGKRKRKVKTI